MLIHRLTAENIKKLVAVTITPAGNLVEITGKNGQGKTSVLDSIWWALAGASTVQGKPIRKGQDKAQITLDLGDLIVTRKFSAKEDGGFTTQLTVTNKEGLQYSSPQAVLDKLLDSLAFDPLEFARAEPKKQLAMLRKFVPGVDFELIELQNKTDYDRRALLNKAIKEHEGAVATIQIPAVEDNGDVDVATLDEKLEAAIQSNASIETRKANRDRAKDQITSLQAAASEKVLQAVELRKRADDLFAAAELQTDEAKQLQAKLDAAGPLPVPIDLTELRNSVAAARAHNDALRRRADRIAEKGRFEKLIADAKAAADKHTKDRDDRIAARDAAIAAASIPVPGITFGEGEVLLNGVPFNQASDAEQLRASIAIAMAGNPKLRVIRVRDGSLLDSDSMQILADMAAEKEYQVWCETVDARGRVAVVIEDGHVKDAAQPVDPS